MSLWRLSWRADPEVRPLADRHYNRQKVGARQFAPPGRALVLKRGEGPSAFWITSWPLAKYVKHAWAGAWVCSAFRNEGPRGQPHASDLIRSAVAATRWFYGEPPSLGMVSFVDPRHVAPKATPGYCFLRAGFKLVGQTREEGLLAYQLLPRDMPAAQPAWNMRERHRDAGSDVVVTPTSAAVC